MVIALRRLGQKPFSGFCLHHRPCQRSFRTSRSESAVLSATLLEPKIVPHHKPSEIPGIAKDLKLLSWDIPPRNIFLIKKPWEPKVRRALVDLILDIRQKYDINIILESDTAEEVSLDLPKELDVYSGSATEIQKVTDLVVTLGGDGTILHAASLFSTSSGALPPFLSFSMGTVGFLLPFDIKDHSSTLHNVLTSQSYVLRRPRLRVHAKGKTTFSINDINIYRGSDPHLTMLDISVDDEFVTCAIADGVIVSTPTGSTAYSLSSGGSIVHPSVECTLITPICPRSLSFRPLVFPATSKVSISVSPESRGQNVELSVDGLRKGSLGIGDEIIIETEPGDDMGVWCVARENHDWIKHLNELLGFNSAFGTKSRT